MIVGKDLHAYDRHFALIGKIAFLWNQTEGYMNMLIGSFREGFGMRDHILVSTLTNKVANRDRLYVLKRLCEEFPMGRIGERRLALAQRAFAILNENRNCLIHSRHAIPEPRGQVRWVRASKSSPGKVTQSIASLRDLQSQVRSLEQFIDFLKVLSLAVGTRRWRQSSNIMFELKPWPPGFREPRKLVQPTLPADHRSARSLLPKQNLGAKKIAP